MFGWCMSVELCKIFTFVLWLIGTLGRATYLCQSHLLLNAIFSLYNVQYQSFNIIKSLFYIPYYICPYIPICPKSIYHYVPIHVPMLLCLYTPCPNILMSLCSYTPYASMTLSLMHIYPCASIWNDLPSTIQNCTTLPTFKKALYNFYLAKTQF